MFTTAPNTVAGKIRDRMPVNVHRNQISTTTVTTVHRCCMTVCRLRRLILPMFSQGSLPVD